jgi:hypothetical protein
MQTGHPTVDRVSRIHFQGNIVQHSWYQHIQYSNTRGTFTDHTACLVLADIVWWYRHIEVRDEMTGHISGYRKQFAGDKLQRSPSAFADLLGCSVKVARTALSLLENLKLITIELRSVKTTFGIVPNTMFIDLNPERLSEITHPLTKKPETLEKSLLPISVSTSPETGMSDLPISVSHSPEMGNSSIYREHSKEHTKEHAQRAAPDLKTELKQPEQPFLFVEKPKAQEKAVKQPEQPVATIPLEPDRPNIILHCQKDLGLDQKKATPQVEVVTTLDNQPKPKLEPETRPIAILSAPSTAATEVEIGSIAPKDWRPPMDWRLVNIDQFTDQIEFGELCKLRGWTPGWRLRWGVNGIKTEFSTYIRDVYLPTTPAYSKGGKPDMVTAKNWINVREGEVASYPKLFELFQDMEDRKERSLQHEAAVRDAVNSVDNSVGSERERSGIPQDSKTPSNPSRMPVDKPGLSEISEGTKSLLQATKEKFEALRR